MLAPEIIKSFVTFVSKRISFFELITSKHGKSLLALFGLIDVAT